MEKGRILIAEDERNLRVTLSDILAEEGYEVTTVGDGREAIELARHHYFDVFLLDLRMPTLDGEKTFRLLKESYPSARVILMSGYGQDHLKQSLLQQGALAFVDKPVDIEELLEIIEEVDHPSILCMSGKISVPVEIWQTLRDHGYRVTLVQSPEDGMELVKHVRFDIIMIDVELMGPTDNEICLSLKDLDREVPTFMLVNTNEKAEQAEQLAEEVVRSTAFSFLLKPLNKIVLMDLLTRIRRQRLTEILNKRRFFTP
ncbi:Hypothetical protein PBC10988_28640 [Planctomycetales bacterium 10988]|nr:Hypothetical protein PBC10988_28640 [Planctomycetales bacterium 10988]